MPSSLSTCIVIEHPKAVGVVVPEELPCDDSMVLLDHLQVLLIEALPEPRFVLSLLKEPGGHVANNVHLQGRDARRGSEATSLILHCHISKPAVSPKASRQAQRDRLPESSALPSRFQHSLHAGTVCPTLPHLRAFAHAVRATGGALLVFSPVNPTRTSTPSSKGTSFETFLTLQRLVFSSSGPVTKPSGHGCAASTDCG